MRWDNISDIVYGTPFKIHHLISANPLIAISPILPSGTVLIVPILSGFEIKSITDLLPPWKR